MAIVLAVGAVAAAVLWAPLPWAQLIASVALGLAAAWFGARPHR